MLAIVGHRAAAIAINIDQLVAVEGQDDVDAVGHTLRALDARGDVGEIVTRPERRHTSLELVVLSLAQRRLAEEFPEIISLRQI